MPKDWLFNCFHAVCYYVNSVLYGLCQHNFESNNFTVFYFQIGFKNQHCKCNNAHLMFRIFIKIRNLALTLWSFKWYLRTLGCVFFICNHRCSRKTCLLKYSNDHRKKSVIWEIKEKLSQNLYIPDFY